MTPEQLRDVAWALDALTKVTKTLLKPLAAMDAMNAETLDVTIELTRDDRPLSPADAQALLDWVDDDEMQDDLRQWADQLEADDA